MEIPIHTGGRPSSISCVLDGKIDVGVWKSGCARAGGNHRLDQVEGGSLRRNAGVRRRSDRCQRWGRRSGRDSACAARRGARGAGSNGHSAGAGPGDAAKDEACRPRRRGTPRPVDHQLLPAWTPPTAPRVRPSLLGKRAYAAAPFRPVRRGSASSVYSGIASPWLAVWAGSDTADRIWTASSVRGVGGEAGATPSSSCGRPANRDTAYPWPSGAVYCGREAMRRGDAPAVQRRTASADLRTNGLTSVMLRSATA